tara:strand:+ start:614 stop:868 length:255 start_codon:yes stop_codon:yes gene_type:complete
MTLQTALRKKSKLIYGTELVRKSALKKELSEIYCASNYPVGDFSRFEEISESSGFTLTRTKENSEELGALLRKPFLISVIGVKK